MISVTKGGELIDDEGAAFEKFKKCRATARKKKKGSIKIWIRELIRSEAELDGDTSERPATRFV